MLLMNCPKCDGAIKSPFLAEIKSVDCWQCKEEVKVRNVFVSTKGFTMSREDLINRISHYKKLLKETEDELQATVEERTTSTKPQEGDKSFHSILKDLMLGARDNFRLDIPYDLYVELECDDKKRLGRLINICAQGAAIEFAYREELPQAETEIKLSLLLPESAEPLSLPAKIVWTRKSRKDAQSQHVNIGVHYNNLDKKTHTCIWDFIVKTSSLHHQVLNCA
ncbi:MAG: PilZ domain-containing protein [Desulfuromonadales bacterium]|nr:PilZ domain-containing protein [Desulfuromonadales bacterium]